jgi:hypothetical protein
MKAGLTLIVLGVGSALWFQHLDAIVWGGFMVLVGAWMLTIKEKKA